MLAGPACYLRGLRIQARLAGSAGRPLTEAAAVSGAAKRARSRSGPDLGLPAAGPGRGPPGPARYPG